MQAVHHKAMTNRFEIVVEGIDDAALVSAIDTSIRDAFREMALPGSWRVVVKPSGQPTQAGGRWDFTVYGLDVRHNVSIALTRAASSIPSTTISKRLVMARGGRLASGLPKLIHQDVSVNTLESVTYRTGWKLNQAETYRDRTPMQLVMTQTDCRVLCCD